MPKLITDRFAHDSIREFRAAAAIRNEDARRLAASGRGAAAVYLWGYVSEMTLKAAWFSLLGRPEMYRIGMTDLRSAKVLGQSTYGIVWPPDEPFHNVECWATLLTRHRAALQRSYVDPTFGSAVLTHSQRVQRRWRVCLRYKKNSPYAFEIGAVSESAQWFLTNSLVL